MLSNLLWWPWAQIGVAGPVVAEYNPVGKPTPGLLTDLPVRRSRRRRREMILAEEDDLLVVLLDEL